MNKVPVYWRRIIVRAIEDAIVLGGMCLGTALICQTVSQVFIWLGCA